MDSRGVRKKLTPRKGATKATASVTNTAVRNAIPGPVLFRDMALNKKPTATRALTTKHSPPTTKMA